jgi:hypothetical protein
MIKSINMDDLTGIKECIIRYSKSDEVLAATGGEK